MTELMESQALRELEEMEQVRMLAVKVDTEFGVLVLCEECGREHGQDEAPLADVPWVCDCCGRDNTDKPYTPREELVEDRLTRAWKEYVDG